MIMELIQSVLSHVNIGCFSKSVDILILIRWLRRGCAVMWHDLGCVVIFSTGFEN